MTISFASERDMVHQARAGNEVAFERLVTAFTPDLYRVVRRMTADADTAQAVIQETFWRVWRALPRYTEERRFFPYLVTVAANLLRDAWRKDRRVLPDELDTLAALPDASPTPEYQVEEEQLLQALAAAVERLPAPYRAVIALRYEAGLGYEDIASALDLPLNTVRTFLHRAKASLRVTLEETDDQD